MSPNTARTDPRLIRSVLEYAENHGPVITARKFDVDHSSVYRWQQYRERYGAAWPTDQDIADWDAKAEGRRKNAERKARYDRAVYLNRGPILVDATGSIRRLRALNRIGWTMEKLGAQPEMGVSAERISQFARGRHRTLRPETVAAIKAMYDRLTNRHTPLPTGRNADYARKQAELKGWSSPLSWDDEAIDDPNAHPVGIITERYTPAGYDESRVQRRIAGDRTVKLHKGESAEVVRRMLADGWSTRAINQHTGIKVERYAKVTTQPEQVAA